MCVFEVSIELPSTYSFICYKLNTEWLQHYWLYKANSFSCLYHLNLINSFIVTMKRMFTPMYQPHAGADPGF